MLTIALVLLVLVLAGAGKTYPGWGRRGPLWGGDALYLAAGLVILALIITLSTGVRL